MDYDEELHTAWVTKALHLAMEYREAEPGREVRDAMRAMKAHFEGRPASMPMQDTVADDMDEVAKQYAHKLAHDLENVATMLRKCAHRLNANGHEDLGADAVGLLRRLDLLGSPLRQAVPDSKPPNASYADPA